MVYKQLNENISQTINLIWIFKMLQRTTFRIEQINDVNNWINKLNKIQWLQVKHDVAVLNRWNSKLVVRKMLTKRV